jgi:rubrerythrin
MTDSKPEPWMVASMSELLALAHAMEQEAVAGYVALAERMRNQDRPDLAAVFDRLTAEEEGHLGNVDRWLVESGEAKPAAPVILSKPLFDDEGTAIIAPELLSSYRAFSMAVRNEERAFVFWTYVAAHAPSDAIRQAAERMAREELGHVATLRRERRLAFHDMRRSEVAAAPGDLASLELRLADQLAYSANQPAAKAADRLRPLAGDAQARAARLKTTPFGGSPLLERVPDGIGNQLVPLCEFLLDCYLDLAEREKTEEARDLAQEFASGVIQCLQIVRRSD